MSNKNLKSVHITNYYHKNSGGISTSYNNLLAAAGRHERYISLIVPGEREEIEQVNDYAKIYYIPAKQAPVFDKRYRMIMPWQYMPSGTRIREILLEEKPNLVEVTDKYTLSMLGAMVRLGKFKQLGRPMLVHFSCERMDDNISSFLTTGKTGAWLARSVIGNYTLPTFDFHRLGKRSPRFFSSFRLSATFSNISCRSVSHIIPKRPRTRTKRFCVRFVCQFSRRCSRFLLCATTC